ncbi:hypothetical protein HNR23_003181 [Nocardiopsis mwathae]|uniref:Uncharacterized protein n=1 Tax=Nocardiopsis mwathae TaxID=1472723 RepID=A0A7X0D6W2_9ACTN|nr:hypothetical protein [Nocardiopsis mwathae]MBB6173121.1 hypothetical protein [Nocardiopsis mwathae]
MNIELRQDSDAWILKWGRMNGCSFFVVIVLLVGVGVGIYHVSRVLHFAIWLLFAVAAAFLESKGHVLAPGSPGRIAEGPVSLSVLIGRVVRPYSGVRFSIALAAFSGIWGRHMKGGLGYDWITTLAMVLCIFILGFPSFSIEREGD